MGRGCGQMSQIRRGRLEQANEVTPVHWVTCGHLRSTYLGYPEMTEIFLSGTNVRKVISKSLKFETT